MLDFTIGADPELFVWDTVNKNYVSAHPYFPGTKDQPHKVGPGAIQVDGTAFEFNIEPCISADQFIRSIRTMQIIGNNILPEGLVLRAEPTAYFKAEYFSELPFAVKLLGCQPDFSGYTGKQNKKPKTDKPFHTRSRHIHVGWTKDLDLDNPAVMQDLCTRVRQLDHILYPASLLWDPDVERRSLYGAKGAFRPKPYGFEYRVLSNAWLNSPDIMAWIFDTTIWTMEDMDSGYLCEEDPYNREQMALIDSGEAEPTEIADYIETLSAMDPSMPAFPFDALEVW